MPSTSTMASISNDKIFLLGRSIERHLETSTMAALSLDETSGMNGAAELSAEILSQQVAAGGSALYSIEELSRWSSPHCTALIHALLASFSVILVSELGDKTFIITAIMAMKNSRSLVFIASAMALLLMTILSVGMGVAVTVVPKLYTHYASIVLFLCFGLKMLLEAYEMGAESEESEFDEVKRTLEEAEDDGTKSSADDNKAAEKAAQLPVGNQLVSTNPEIAAVTASESGQHAKVQATPITVTTTVEAPKMLAKNASTQTFFSRLVKTLYIAPIIIKVFTMVFVAEWGDRSQISTVILAAREDVAGVFVGSLSGHILCTGLAVIGGRFVADVISVRTMTLIGGIIFLFFAAFAIISGPEQV